MVSAIRVRIPLTPSVFSLKFVFEKIDNEQKEAGVCPFFLPSVGIESGAAQMVFAFYTVAWTARVLS